MEPYVTSAEVNVFSGILVGSIPFKPGLNILSGENGTCKTQLLMQIKQGKIKVSDNLQPNQIRIQAFSPKRNSERKSIDRVFQELRSQSRDFPYYIKQRISAQLQDITFENYSALGELYYYVYDKECKDGGNQKEKMRIVQDEFNIVIKKIFGNYELLSEWDEPKGRPTINLKKNNSQVLSPESLSCGEQEILSLVLNLYVSRDSTDVFLIDEPEIHLNWHLEERLFTFMDWFCSTYSKQIIVATHSRVVFKKDFLKRTQFLFWENEKVKFDGNIPGEQHRKIAGEAIDIIKLGDFEKPTFFVEDGGHSEVIETLSTVFGTQVSVSECGNSYNVKSLFRLSKQEGGWNNSFFLTDGDNQGNPYPSESQFLHLDKYCIENYLLNFEIATRVTGKTEKEIKQAIFDSIKKNSGEILNKNKWFEFLVSRLRIEDITQESLDKLDASKIFPHYLREISMERSMYIKKYLALLHEESKVDSVFPPRLIQALKGPVEQERDTGNPMSSTEISSSQGIE